MNFEQALFKSLDILHKMTSVLVSVDFDLFFGHVFSSAEYDRTAEDKNSLDQLNKLYTYRDEVEKIQRLLTVVHPGKNVFDVATGSLRKISDQIHYRSNSVNEIEDIAGYVNELPDDESLSARSSIVSAYLTVRDAYLGVDRLIEIYNSFNQDHKLPRLRTPKEVKRP
jgi:hypothetical protein